MQISAREVLAGVAIAGRIQRRIVVAMERVTDFQYTGIGEQMAVAGVAGRHHAVEHVDATAHTFDQIFRLAYTHQVTRFVCRHEAWQVVQHLDHLVLGFAHRQTANRQTVETDFVQTLQRALAQVLVHAT